MPGKGVQYHVDPRNRRSVKIVNGNFLSRYVWEDQLRLIAELDQNNNVKARFVYAEGVNSPEYMVKDGRKFMFIKDQRGSVNLVVDSETGEVKQKMRYSDWGEVLEDTNPGFQPFGFAGGLYDHDTLLVKFGARDYDAQFGRWISKDPIQFEGDDENLYSFVYQDPINHIDPAGESGLVGAIFGAGVEIGLQDTQIIKVAAMFLMLVIMIGGMWGFLQP